MTPDMEEPRRLWSGGQTLVATLLFAVVTALGDLGGERGFGRSFLVGVALGILPALMFLAYARRLKAESTSWGDWFKTAVPLLLVVALSYPIGEFFDSGARELTREEIGNALPIVALVDALLIFGSRWAFSRATWGDERLRRGLSNFFSILLLVPVAYLAWVIHV